VQTSSDGINTLSIPRNIGVENAYGLEANFSADPIAWLNINGNANLFRAVTQGRFNEIVLDRDTYTARFRLNNKINFGKLDIQLSGNYMAPEKTTQGTRKSMYSADLGANLEVLKGNGTINLSGRDLFNTRKYRGTTVTDNFVQDSEFQWRSRQVIMSFTYRLKQNKNRGRGNRDENYDEQGDF
jgi:hypothetical protein